MKALLCLFFAAATASAIPIQVIYGDAANTGFYDPAPRAALPTNPGTTLGEQRRIAFEFALSRWSTQIAGTIPLKVRAAWSSTPDAAGRITLASASPVNFFKNGTEVSGLPRNNTFFASALADQVMGLNLISGGTSDDISVDCNSYLDEVTTDGYVWDYGLDNSAASGTSFVGVTLHEIGHGLGFISFLSNTTGNYGLSSPSAWEALMTNASGTFLSTMTAANRIPLITGNALYSDGATLRLYNQGNPPRVHAPATYSGGSSLHHFDETVYSNAGSFNELMTPLVSFPTQMFGPLVTSALRDMGYTMADTLPPVADIVSPVPGRPYTSAALTAAGIFGTTTDTSAGGSSNAVGLLRVRLALYSHPQGKWYRWGNTPGFDSPTFQYATHTKDAPIEKLLPVTTGSHKWTSTLPAGLADGNYEIHIESVDQNDQGSGFISSAFTIDNAAPSLTIEPWVTNDTIFNLNNLAFLAPEAVSVGFQLRRIDGATIWYWTGTNWSSTPFSLTTTQTGGRWLSDAALPGRNNWPQGQPILIRAVATDSASNTQIAQVTVNRSAADTTLPVVSISQPTSGQVLTIPVLPPVQGNAQDLESGITSVSLTINRFVSGGGVEFWSGSGWTGSAVNLPVSYDKGNGGWIAPSGWALPGGSSLPNGNYAMQITATNGESPAGSSGAGIAFSVDYHPVYNWTGGTLRDSDPYNNSNSWGTPQNWSPYGTPGPGDVVIININDRIDSDFSRTLHGLEMSTGWINFTNGPGNFGTLTTTNNTTWTGGTISGIWECNGTTTISGPATKLLWDGATLNNYGTITWQGGGAIHAQANNGNAIINNKAGATFRVIADGIVFSRSAPYYRPVFNNLAGAVLEKSGTGGSSILHTWKYNNAGEIRCGSGTLAFENNMGDADLTLNPGTTLTGSGRLRWQTDVELNTAVNAICSVDLPEGGSLNSQALSMFQGTLHWTGGIFYGVTTIGPAGVVNLSDAVLGTPKVKLLWDGAVLNNQGTINWLGGGSLQARADNGTATFNNLPGGTFNMAADGPPFTRATPYYTPVFNNEPGATFRKTAGSGTTLIHTFAFNHRGGLVCDTGVLAFNTALNLDSTTPWTGAGTYEMQGGTSTLTGSTTLGGPAFSILAGDVVGAIDGTGAFITTGASSVEWKGGTFHRTLRLTPGSKLNLSGAAVKLLWDGAVLDNQGTVTWKGGGPLRAQANNAPATVNNLAGSNFHVAADGVVFDRDAPYYTPVFNNFAGAKFIRTVGDGSATIHTYTFNNEGKISAGTGVLEFNTVLNLKHGGNLLGSGQFQMLGGSTNFTGTTSLSGPNFSVLGGTISGANNAVVTSSAGGAWRWLKGHLSGTLEIGTNSELQIANPATGSTEKLFLDGAVINNKGLISWSEGTLQGQANNGISTLNNRAGGRISVTTDGFLFTRQAPYTMPVINNDAGAVFEKPAGSPALSSNIDWAFNNNGSVQSGAGKLDFLQAGDSNGVFTADAGAFLRFRGGSHMLRNGAALSGAGLIQVVGGTVLGDGNLNGNTLSPGAFELLSGTLGGTMNYSGSGLFHWAGGTLSGTLTLAAGTQTNLDGALDKVMGDGAALNNHGTLTWLGGGPIVAQANNGNATLTNKSGGTFRMAADGNVFSRYSPYYRPIFNNDAGALFEKQGTSGTSTLHTWRYNNAGEIRSGSGILAFTNNMPDVDLYLDPGTTLTGSGRLRLQADARLATTVNALCPVDLMESGSLTCQPLSIFQGTLDWTGGIVFGEMTVGPAGIVNLSDAVPGTPKVKLLWDGAVLNNQGTINWLGGGSLQAQANYGTATFNNQPGGVFHAVAGGTAFTRAAPYYTPIFNNSGSFRIGSATATCTLNNWGFTQSGTGALNIDVAGPAVTEFDRFVVTSAAVTLGGTLNVTKLNDYAPATDTTFAFLTSSARAGQFGSVNAPGFQVEYNAGGATLRAGGLAFSAWALAAQLTGADALASADPDGDGQTNFAEYVFNTDPKSGNQSPGIVNQETVEGQPWLTLNYRRWDDRISAGVIYSAEGSAEMSSWSAAGVIEEVNPAAPVISGSVAYRCRVPMNGPIKFLHVKAHN